MSSTSSVGSVGRGFEGGFEVEVIELEDIDEGEQREGDELEGDVNRLFFREMRVSFVSLSDARRDLVTN